MNKKTPPIWSSESKYYIPFHMCIMALTFLATLFITLELKASAIGESDRVCLAQNIYFESANQPEVGRMAVAQVVINRVYDDQFPDSICGVVYQSYTRENWKGDIVPILHKCQFSWYCDGKSDVPTDSQTWSEALDLADSIMSYMAFDVTSGALYYHTTSVDPYWNDYLTPTVTINDHIFYK
tara:strand:+ start:4409 stop:4954 length:546 start_codon:yes stop_codon:yes gene_type:complete